ncbi:MAG: hypothetical protein Q9166_000992 [cf. Caloplaca sp. 2 TL-2023]
MATILAKTPSAIPSKPSTKAQFPFSISLIPILLINLQRFLAKHFTYVWNNDPLPEILDYNNEACIEDILGLRALRTLKVGLEEMGTLLLRQKDIMLAEGKGLEVEDHMKVLYEMEMENSRSKLEGWMGEFKQTVACTCRAIEKYH